MKNVLLIAAGVIAISANAAVYQAPYEQPKYDRLHLLIKPGTNCCWEIQEDVDLFGSNFCQVNYCDLHMTYAQHRELAAEIARTIVRFYGATNASIRFAHKEYPQPASTNIFDVILSRLSGKMVTDEVVEVRK